MDKIVEIDLNALEISDVVADWGKDDETLSQVMAASTTTTGCTCSSCSSS